MVVLDTNCWKFLVPAVLFLFVWGAYNSLYSDMDITWTTKESQFTSQHWQSHSLFQSSQTGSGAHRVSYSVAKRGAFPSRTLWPWDMKLTNHLHLVLRFSTVEMHIHCPILFHSIQGTLSTLPAYSNKPYFDLQPCSNYILLILTGKWLTSHLIRAIWTLRHSITRLVYRHTRSIHMAHEHIISTTYMDITILFIFSTEAIVCPITHPWWQYAGSWKRNYTATLHVFLYTTIQISNITMVKILIWGTMTSGFYCTLKLRWWTLLTFFTEQFLSANKQNVHWGLNSKRYIVPQYCIVLSKIPCVRGETTASFSTQNAG